MVPVLSFSLEQPEYSNPPALMSAGLSFHMAMEKKKEKGPKYVKSAHPESCPTFPTQSADRSSVRRTCHGS